MSSNKGKKAAAQQKAENARIQAENTRRSNDQVYNNEVQAEKQRKIHYTNTRKSDLQQAGLDAQEEETNYRAKAIRDSGNVLTDWEMQEKIRLLQARKGTGQVDAEDMRITNDNLQASKSLLDKGAEYWDARRKVAFDRAYQAADSGYGKFTDKTVTNKNNPVPIAPKATKATKAGKAVKQPGFSLGQGQPTQNWFASSIKG